MTDPVLTAIEARLSRLEKSIEWFFSLFGWPRHPEHPDPMVDANGNPTDPTPVEPPAPPVSAAPPPTADVPPSVGPTTGDAPVEMPAPTTAEPVDTPTETTASIN